MSRNAEVIRQWTILREIERARSVTIDQLASLCQVTTRTIRRDLQALEEAGFPLFDDRSHDDGRTRWSINGQAFRALTAGLTLSELCALYFSRTLVESLAGTPFRDDVERAFDKLSSNLTSHMRQFLDRLPRIITAKPGPVRRQQALPAQEQRITARALDATLQSRQALIIYDSKSSGRVKEYRIHPLRLAYAESALYLLAHVPEYQEIRTFAVDRIREFTLLDERFTPTEDAPDDAFSHSLGVHSGPPEQVELEFQKAVADYVCGRAWHPSQTVTTLPTGAVRLSLRVCLDQALRSWILSFGPFARVLTPASLAQIIARQLTEARAQYPGP